METFGLMAFTMAMAALSISIMGFLYFHGRLKNLEKKLKEFDVIPKEFDSIPEEFQEIERQLPSQD